MGTLEFVLKFADLKLDYFKTAWNLFDFVLVTSGIVGCIFSIMVFSLPDRGNGNSLPTNEAKLVKVAQVFRMMRLLRLMRLSRYTAKIRAYFSKTHISFEVAEHMQKVTVLSGFIR